MVLKKRHLFRANILIQGDGESKTKATTSTVDLALEKLDPATVADALQAYVDQWWSDKPHTITKIANLQYIGELYAEMDYDEEIGQP